MPETRLLLRLPGPPRVHPALAWAVALAAPLLALGAQLALRPLTYATPFVLFFLAVAAAAWVGGLRHGLLATLLSGLLANYFFLHPVNAFGVTPAALLSLTLFLAVGTLLSVLSASLRVHDRERERLLAEARAAVALRDEFLQVAAHELRTPLTSLRLQLGALARSLPAETREAGRVAASERSALRLQLLVESLLDVTRLDAGRLELTPTHADLVQLVREALERLGPVFAESGSPVHFTPPPAPLLGLWDVPRLEQVLVNLLSNAAKYGAGKPVHVALQEEPESVRFTVRDEGIGIAPEVLPRLFGRFERGVSERHYGGLGLGLYISRQLVGAMGGRLEVESTLGQGATFTLWLPRGLLAATGSHSLGV